MTTATATADPAVSNAAAWSESISAAHEAWLFCQEETEGRDLSREAKAVLHQHEYDGDNHADVAEAIEEEMREGALSVDVRSRWHSPGEEAEPGDFCILLTCGGPALRVAGELNHCSEPCSFLLEHQDWGTPWTRYQDADADALDWFCGLFYYGE